MTEPRIGAPCHCGVAQAFHGGLTCEQAKAAQHAPLKAMMGKAFEQLRGGAMSTPEQLINKIRTWLADTDGKPGVTHVLAFPADDVRTLSAEIMRLQKYGAETAGDLARLSAIIEKQDRGGTPAPPSSNQISQLFNRCLGRVERNEVRLTFENAKDARAALAAIESLGDETPSPQAPIAAIRVGENGTMEVLHLYAPGLPAGEHDLFCEPETAGPYLRETTTARSLLREPARLTPEAQACVDHVIATVPQCPCEERGHTPPCPYAEKTSVNPCTLPHDHFGECTPTLKAPLLESMAATLGRPVCKIHDQVMAHDGDDYFCLQCHDASK